MRRAALLASFALLAVTTVHAQSPAGRGTQPPDPQQSQTPATPAGTPEDPNKGVSSSPQGAASPAGNPAAQGGGSTAQQQNVPPADQGGVVDEIPAGAEIRATLDTPLSSKTSKSGDRFTATITEPARGNGGAIVIPQGARVEGEVAEPEDGKSMAALRDKAVLNLRFRDLVLPSGQTLPLTAALISVNDTNPRNARKADEETPASGGPRGRDIARDAGINAQGANPAPVFHGPLRGLAIGALSGGGYVVSTKGKDVRLPAQTGMVIRLEQPVSAGTATNR